eukprot:299932-Amphidinium_carterae.1
MYRRGLADSPQCTLCGCDDGSYAHRLLHCIGLQRYRDQMPDEVRNYLIRLCKDGALESQLWAPVWPDMLSIYVENAPVRCLGDNAPFSGRIYTDGSSLHTLDAQSRRAGWAGVDPRFLNSHLAPEWSLPRSWHCGSASWSRLRTQEGHCGPS